MRRSLLTSTHVLPSLPHGPCQTLGASGLPHGCHTAGMGLYSLLPTHPASSLTRNNQDSVILHESQLPAEEPRNRCQLPGLSRIQVLRHVAGVPLVPGLCCPGPAYPQTDSSPWRQLQAHSSACGSHREVATAPAPCPAVSLQHLLRLLRLDLMLVPTTPDPAHRRGHCVSQAGQCAQESQVLALEEETLKAQGRTMGANHQPSLKHPRSPCPGTERSGPRAAPAPVPSTAVVRPGVKLPLAVPRFINSLWFLLGAQRAQSQLYIFAVAGSSSTKITLLSHIPSESHAVCEGLQGTPLSQLLVSRL